MKINNKLIQKVDGEWENFEKLIHDADAIVAYLPNSTVGYHFWRLPRAQAYQKEIVEMIMLDLMKMPLAEEKKAKEIIKRVKGDCQCEKCRPNFGNLMNRDLDDTHGYYGRYSRC